jgi:hypothetical protein
VPFLALTTTGQPLRFSGAQSAWVELQTEQTQQLTQALGVAEWRELVGYRHMLLYVNAERGVVLFLQAKNSG